MATRRIRTEGPNHSMASEVNRQTIPAEGLLTLLGRDNRNVRLMLVCCAATFSLWVSATRLHQTTLQGQSRLTVCLGLAAAGLTLRAQETHACPMPTGDLGGFRLRQAMPWRSLQSTTKPTSSRAGTPLPRNALPCSLLLPRRRSRSWCQSSGMRVRSRSWRCDQATRTLFTKRWHKNNGVEMELGQVDQSPLRSNLHSLLPSPRYQRGTMTRSVPCRMPRWPLKQPPS